MRLLIVAAVLLASCARDVLLYPRTGGQFATGKLDAMNQTLEVQIGAESYRGRYGPAGTTTGLVLGTGGAAVAVGSGNLMEGFLSGSAGVLRCQFTLIAGGGHGVCADRLNQLYDMIVK